MKAAVQLQQFKKCLILFMVGIICSALAYALYVINPIKALLEYKLQMAPGSTVFTIWQTPPIDIYIKVYIFNITNPTEFLNGEEKLKVQEIGPYVYKEILKNENVTWNDNGTMSYTPRRTVVYVPEMSVGDPEQDLVMVPNIPMLMYDEGDNTVVMNIKKNENMTDEAGRYLSIESFNGSPGLAYWGYVDVEGNETNPANTMCNRVQGATEGCIFPDNLDRNAVFRVYRKAFCRTMPIVFKKEVVENGFPAYLYSLSDDFLETPDKNPDNECYCRKMEKCLKKGLTDVTPCYYNIPAALSLPHFLDADPTLLEGVEGLHPEEEKHRTKILLQPTVGIPLYVNSRLQTNLVMDHTVYNSRVTPFNDLTVPLFWTDLHIPNLPSDLLLLLRLCLQVLPVVQTVLICLLGIVGVTTFFLSLIGSLWVLNQQQDEEDKKRKDSCDLRIPLGYGQYTAIRILPAIKKITSKTDLFG
ncbi:scavenger receptor class B member 1 isoform X2 [Cephus cinctus]|uniref:Scavenger receptor class B member 1 isoform X2 n=1 Tax=Cephus cinctus TaxID=211228 RepID=A0AAJ7C4T6_CEPCN|nr:scavenger receptor class B member 1 isoform X2 [Cephus cinctus]